MVILREKANTDSRMVSTWEKAAGKSEIEMD